MDASGSTLASYALYGAILTAVQVSAAQPGGPPVSLETGKFACARIVRQPG